LGKAEDVIEELKRRLEEAYEMERNAKERVTEMDKRQGDADR
tara:strand:+ start:96 stop:221 length:126 start_codon:yes stop_codon:yes gene_type:complete